MNNSQISVFALIGLFAIFIYCENSAFGDTLRTDFSMQGQVLSPALMPSAQASYDSTTNQWLTSNELFNPSSGFFTNLAQCPNCKHLNLLTSPTFDPAPLPRAPVDEYGRISWHSLEPEEGRYDFTVINDVIQPCPAPQGNPVCLPKGGRFGFRIMAFSPQYKTETNVTVNTDGYPVYSDLPTYMQKDKKGQTHGWLLPINPRDLTQGYYFIPDWNDQFFLDHAWALVKALGQKYDNDPRIGNIDIGIYGSWGEWHTGGLIDTFDYAHGQIPYTKQDSNFNLNTAAYLANKGVPGAYAVGTEASMESIIWAHVRGLPHKQLVMMTDQAQPLCMAMHINIGSPLIGLRRDSLGSHQGWYSGFPSTSCMDKGTDLISNRWKHAPFITETFGNGSSPTFPCQTFETDPTTGALEILEQIPAFHISSIKNGGYCTGTWSALSMSEQATVYTAGLSAGYRYAPDKIWIPEFNLNAPPSITLHTEWINSGMTPTYDTWNIEYSLWSYNVSGEPKTKITSFLSSLDLRKVLPKSDNFLVEDETFLLPPHIVAGPYELRVRVVDANEYLNSMQLALLGDTDGYYPLGMVIIPQFRQHPVRD